MRIEHAPEKSVVYTDITNNTVFGICTENNLA